MDLLGHEVVESTLLGGLGRPVDRGLGALPGIAVHVGDHDTGRVDVGDVALLEEHDPVGVSQDGRDVAGDEALLAVQADDERDVLARPDEPAQLALVHDDEGVGALELAQGGADGIAEVALVGLLDEVGDRLGVGLGRQRVAARLQPIPQLREVLDDPVVDHRDRAGAVLMGVGVEVVRSAVGRPASVGQPDRGVRRPVGDRGLEVRQLAGLLLDEEVAFLVDEGDPGRVVPAILEPLEAFDQDRARLAWPGIADDTAHVAVVLRVPRQRPSGLVRDRRPSGAARSV